MMNTVIALNHELTVIGDCGKENLVSYNVQKTKYIQFTNLEDPTDSDDILCDHNTHKQCTPSALYIEPRTSTHADTYLTHAHTHMLLSYPYSYPYSYHTHP